MLARRSAASPLRFLAAALAGAVLGFPAAAIAASGSPPSIVIRPAPAPRDNGIPPTFEEYPLWDRLFGSGGAIFPDYRMPPTDKNGRTPVSLLTGGGVGRTVFAAATADSLCQWQQVPVVTVIRGPSSGQLATDIGPFVATGLDAGTTRCVGRQVRGTRVTFVGRLPARPEQVTLRVAYPFRSAYTHVVTLPAR